MAWMRVFLKYSKCLKKWQDLVEKLINIFMKNYTKSPCLSGEIKVYICQSVEYDKIMEKELSKSEGLFMKYLEKHPWIMIIVGVLGISASSIFVKYSQAPSSVTACFRLLWTVLLMTPVVLFKKEPRKEVFSMKRKDVWVCIMSGIFLAIHFALWFESLKHTSVASSTAIVCTEVIWVSLGYCCFMKGKLSWKAILVIIMALLGSVIIAFSDSASGGHVYGDILSLIAAIAVAVYTLLGRKARSTMSTTAYTYVVYGACAVTLLVITLVQGYAIFSFGLSAIIVGLLLSICSTILGHSIFSWCLKYYSPSFVSASKLCEPVVAAVLAIFLFGEIPGWLQIVGGILIIGGVYLYSKIENNANK